MEKWTSPHLTTISREYCKEEFILDKRDLVSNFKEINESKKLQNENIHLFTLDVEKLYPSIQPNLDIISIKEAFAADETTNNKTKLACEELIKFSFDHSYISYKNKTFSSKIGIPTGGSISRQIADIFLHWLLFVKINPKIQTLEAIRFFKRFIDDCIGIWRGTKRSFDSFVNQLNKEASKLGIKFPVSEIQFGRSIDFLDLTVYLDEDNTIQYKGYTKPTDAKRYLNSKSFHPKSVFKSIPFSQMIRTIENNSREETRTTQMNDLVKHFENSGYNRQKLQELKEKAIGKTTTRNPTESYNNNNNTLVFPVYYFDGIEQFKSMVWELQDDIKQLIGNTRIMFTLKKGSSIGNTLVRNKALCMENPSNSTNQKCNAPGCQQCPLVNTEQKMTINDINISIPRSLNCKTRNVIYLWKCKLCRTNECYFGRTTQKCHSRTNGHRGCFKDDKWEKSALSMHAKDMHDPNFTLDNFNISIIKKISPHHIRREEFRFIEKYRTIQLGLNRYKAT